MHAGELAYLPPGCAHAVYTSKSCMTLSGNFFHVNTICEVATSWTYDFIGGHPKECKRDICYHDPTPTGYNRRVCTLLARFVALALNGEAPIKDCHKHPIAAFFKQWVGLSPVRNCKYPDAFRTHCIEPCYCTVPISVIIANLSGRPDHTQLMPSKGGCYPSWKSPQPRNIAIAIREAIKEDAQGPRP